jgi:hypothetical protein
VTKDTFIQDSLSERHHQQEMIFQLDDKNELWVDVCFNALML